MLEPSAKLTTATVPTDVRISSTVLEVAASSPVKAPSHAYWEAVSRRAFTAPKDPSLKVRSSVSGSSRMRSAVVMMTSSILGAETRGPGAGLGRCGARLGVFAVPATVPAAAGELARAAASGAPAPPPDMDSAPLVMAPSAHVTTRYPRLGDHATDPPEQGDSPRTKKNSAPA